ncbi:nuclear transport factor 2 family protein (plasmid) [Salipiger sp. H15]|uniref:Nuclear transport factor 2 family protein n=1 Tax=Alloyangia sp. H15 TaxID=3029062 RepID=A0AAU8AQD4_9RHOB
MTEERLAKLEQRLAVLEAEAEVRRLQARYMFLCDTPNPEHGCATDAERIDRIMELFAPEAVWEGVGEYYDGQFGKAEGWDAVKAHFQNFWGGKKDPALILNCHYLTSEQIRVAGDAQTAEGNWVHMQPWLFSDGKALLRSSRLFNSYRRCEDGVWRFTRNRTENVFVAPLPATWASDYPSTSVLMKP